MISAIPSFYLGPPCSNVSNGENIYFFFSEISFPRELNYFKRECIDQFRVSKRLLLAWFDPPAIDACWRVLASRIEATNDLESSLSIFNRVAIRKGISEAVRILHPTNRSSYFGGITMNFAERVLQALLVSDNCEDGLGLDRLFSDNSDDRDGHDTVRGLCNSLDPKSPSVTFQVEDTMQPIHQLQRNQVLPLCQLSVCALREALFGPIEMKVDALLRSHPRPQQLIFRSQILLEDILCENALQGVANVLSSIENLAAVLR